MATQTAFPNGEGTNTGFTASAGTKPDCVAVANGDTDYVFRQTSAGAQSFTFPAFALGSVTAVNSVAMKVNSKAHAGAMTFRHRLRVNGTVYQGAVTSAPASYTETSECWLTNPNTGAAWTQADAEGTGAAPLQQMDVGGMGGITAGEEFRITQCCLVCDYTPAAAAPTARLGGLVGGAMAS